MIGPIGFAFWMATCVAAIVAGVLLWKGMRIGRRATEVNLLLQSVVISLPGLVYRVGLLGMATVGLGGLRCDLNLHAGPDAALRLGIDAPFVMQSGLAQSWRKRMT